MVSRAATTVEQYLSSLSADQRSAIERVRDTVNAHLPQGYEEGIQFGMISWYIPLARYPTTHNRQPLCLVALAAQKGSNSLHMLTVYGDKKVEAKFRAGFKAAGKKLDMGKACVRFKTADALALDVIATTIADAPVDLYIATYETGLAKRKSGKAKAKPTAAKKPAKKLPAKRR